MGRTFFRLSRSAIPIALAVILLSLPAALPTAAEGLADAPSVSHGYSIATKVAPAAPIPSGQATPSGFASSAAQGSGWSNLSGAIGPGPTGRIGAAMALDPLSGQIFLFGGLGTGGAIHNDLWIFNYTEWVNLTPMSPTGGNWPSPRVGAVLFYDPGSGKMILFGGRDQNIQFGETWEFNPVSLTNWTNASATSGGPPPGRSWASAATNYSGGYAVMFGGRTPSLVYHDTWEFRAGQWTNITLTPNNGPERRFNASFAFDPALSAFVLFGGLGFNPPFYPSLADTWLLRGENWTQVGTSFAPSNRSAAVFSYAPSLDLLVLYGGVGASGPPLGDTWSFSSSDTWANLTFNLSSSPPPSSGGASAPSSTSGDPSGYFLMYGGLQAGGSATLATWVFGAPKLTVASVAARPNPLDLGQSTTLAARVFGGSGAYSYSWTNLPAGCLPADTPLLLCTPAGTGTTTVIVVVDDTAGSPPTSGKVTLSVEQPPTISAFRVSPKPPLIVNTTNMTFSVTVSGGAPLNVSGMPAYLYNYTGLPLGCPAPSGKYVHKFSCIPNATGVYNVSVEVTDAAGVSANQTLVVTIVPPSGPSGLTTFWLAVIVGAAVVATAGAIAFLWLRRRGSSPPPGRPGRISAAPAAPASSRPPSSKPPAPQQRT